MSAAPAARRARPRTRPKQRHFSKGDRVTWSCTGRRAVEFGPSVPAVVNKVGAKRLQVLACRPIPYSIPAREEWALRWVDPAELAPRLCPSSSLGEELRIVIGQFVLTPWKHPVGRLKHFPKGIWYGAIDGYEATAPCYSPEAALWQAHQALLGGAYRVSLITHVETFEGWLKQPEPYASEARVKLADLRARLAKLDRFPVAQ